MIQIPEFIWPLSKTNIPFLVWKRHLDPFLIWVIFWISIQKLSWVLRGKIVVNLENNFWLLNSARSFQTVKITHSFLNVYYTWYNSLGTMIIMMTDRWSLFLATLFGVAWPVEKKNPRLIDSQGVRWAGSWKGIFKLTWNSMCTVKFSH